MLSSIDAILEKIHQSLDSRNIPILYHKIPTKTTPTHTNKHPQPLTQPNSIKSPTPDADTDATQPSSEISLAHTTIFYIGSESVGLTNLLMTNASSKVRLLLPLTHHYIQKLQIFSFNPTSQTVRLESSRSNKLLMRRYAMVQKARDADVFGILVGTLGVGKPCPPIRLSHLY